MISEFQDELRIAVRRFNAELSETSRRKKDLAELDAVLNTGITITYSEFGSNVLEGRIHHDDLLVIAKIMFEENSLLNQIVAAQYPVIFVDEYQDTSPLVISILLDHIHANVPATIVGFFGDKKQAIYDNVVGELDDAHKSALLEIQKTENYRCSTRVIDVLNNMRTDIKQEPASDNVKGAALYVGINAASSIGVEEAYEQARPHLDAPPPLTDAKVLYLTHRLISREAGYGTLFATYNKCGGFTKDQFQSGKDLIANFLNQEIDVLAEDWRTGNQASALALLQEGGFILSSFDQRKTTQSALDSLVKVIDAGASVREVLAHVQETGLLRSPEKLVDGIVLAGKSVGEVEDEDKKSHTFFTSLLAVPFHEVSAYRAVMANNTPYSTKHGVKGDEFDTVIVVLDDAGARWTKYAFGKQLEGKDTSEDRWNRTSNLFYVCCSRARINLVVIDLGYSTARQPGIDHIFGKSQLIL